VSCGLCVICFITKTEILLKEVFPDLYYFPPHVNFFINTRNRNWNCWCRFFSNGKKVFEVLLRSASSLRSRVRGESTLKGLVKGAHSRSSNASASEEYFESTFLCNLFHYKDRRILLNFFVICPLKIVIFEERH